MKVANLVLIVVGVSVVKFNFMEILKMKKLLMLTLLLIPFNSFASDINKDIVDNLQASSVTVVTPHGSGSGVIRVRDLGQDKISFVFTAAHVVDGLRKVKNVIDGKTGTQRLIVEFDDALVVRTLIEDGRTIGKTEVFAKVIKFNQEEDISILQVRQKNFSTKGVQFYLENVPPKLATPVVHVGSLLGELGSNSVTLGIISQHGRLIENKIFDQTTATAFPGSSGGGVFLYDGRLVGQVLRGAGEQFVLMGPARRTVQWAKDAGVEWAVDDRVPMPSEKELKSIVVEDNGINFDSSKSTSQTKKMMYYNNAFLRMIACLPL